MSDLRSSLTNPRAIWHNCVTRLAAPIDGASLAVFRICFGAAMAWQLVKCLWPRAGTNTVQWLYVDVGWNFPYAGFEWVRPWPEPFLTAHFVVAILAAVLVATGFRYRTAAVTLFLSSSYIFLLEQADFNNHYYLQCLIAFLLIVLPAQKRFSVDAWLARRKTQLASAPQQEAEVGIARSSSNVPFWSIYLLRFQLFVVYFYGGIAKINSDWLTGQPLAGPGKILLDSLAEIFNFTPTAVLHERLCLFLAWGGLAYDLSIGFLLLFRRTRYLAIALTFLFHLHNHFIFPIGVFPLMAFTATLIFLEPDWPVRLIKWLRRPSIRRPDTRWLLGGAFAVPLVGAALGWKERRSSGIETSKPMPLRRAVLAFVLLWTVSQLALPLRHNFIPGDANWTEEAHYFSWRMMLRSKAAGHVTFHVDDRNLIVKDAQGNSRVNWDLLPSDHPRAIHVPVDCRRFNWSHHPGLTMIREPGIGLRMIFHPAENTDEKLAAASQSIEQLWQQKFGRLPLVTETNSPAETFADLRRVLNDARDARSADRQQVAKMLRLIAFGETLIATPSDESPTQYERRFVRLADLFTSLMGSELRELVRPAICRLHPFALQGASFPGDRFLAVYDPNIKNGDSDKAMLDLSHGQPYLVWFDLSRIRPAAWKQLPPWFVTFERKQLRIVWNYFRELNAKQIEIFTVRPIMIHQYAQRIAERWQDQLGRRPEVRVNSYVMLNYRYPQPLVDARVDLASTDYHLLSHNDWILPMLNPRMSDMPLPAKRRTAAQPTRNLR